jgi:maltodextrin utilization protein YvdJ
MLVAYLMFCLTTAIVAHIYLFSHILSVVEDVDGKKNNLIEYKGITVTVIFLLSLVLAPVLVGILVSDYNSDVFIDATIEAFLNKD